MNPWDEIFVAANAAAAAAGVIGEIERRRLGDYPSVPPTQQQLDTVSAAFRRGTVLGLDLPPGKDITVVFVDAPYDIERASTAIFDGGRFRIVFRRDLQGHDLVHVTLHELMHVHDGHAGTFKGMTTEECEQRAIRFASRAIDGWW